MMRNTMPYCIQKLIGTLEWVFHSFIDPHKKRQKICKYDQKMLFDFKAISDVYMNVQIQKENYLLLNKHFRNHISNNMNK